MRREASRISAVAVAIGVAAAAVIAFIPPTVGVCGTAHSFIVSVLASLIWESVDSVDTAVQSQPIIAHVLVAIVNAAIFAPPAWLIHRYGPTSVRLKCVLVATWIALFAWSWFLAFPTADCP
jgi:hypothetical protein